MRISDWSSDVCSSDLGNAHPELHEIEAIFHESASELTRHMKKEELILFPFIRKLAKMKNRGESINDPSSVGAIQNPANMMLHDHYAEAERFKRMSVLSNHFTPPERSEEHTSELQ